MAWNINHKRGGVYLVEKVMYECEKCSEVFNTAEECLSHSINCGYESFVCECCGEEFIFKKDDYATKNTLHTLDMGVLGYNSFYDGIHVKTNVCEGCLVRWFISFKNTPNHEYKRRFDLR